MGRATPICSSCPYMKVRGRAICNGNNNGNPRGYCMCEHPKAFEMFRLVCPKSTRLACFIDYTARGGNTPQIKTSPRWCPRRVHWFPGRGGAGI